jgi:hypothetical protein
MLSSTCQSRQTLSRADQPECAAPHFRETLAAARNPPNDGFWSGVSRAQKRTSTLLARYVQSQALARDDDLRALGVLGNPLLRACADGIQGVVGAIGVVMK